MPKPVEIAPTHRNSGGVDDARAGIRLCHVVISHFLVWGFNCGVPTYFYRKLAPFVT